eukprot:CAMPEP_0115637008 /NCGR_PEP_ID=MMETSP0272-20121206/33966_1 /TAXON_ID=71861 /ORGANISM="Scrippsiella trochoidea, Strain CCMP3099" /LENGTH=73 /DNA_ID=CAMNT_0003074037 /DNA_START=960 /DNA_END=1178 /DNA_ORIENTATION=+
MSGNSLSKARLDKAGRTCASTSCRTAKVLNSHSSRLPVSTGPSRLMADVSTPGKHGTIASKRSDLLALKLWPG